MRFRPLVAEEMLVHWQCLLPKGRRRRVSTRSGRVVLALGAAHVGKAIPLRHWHDIVGHLTAQGKSVDLIGGPDEVAMAAELVAVFEGCDVVSHCGVATWSETFALIQKGGFVGRGRYRGHACRGRPSGAHGGGVGMHFSCFGNGPMDAASKHSSSRTRRS